MPFNSVLTKAEHELKIAQERYEKAKKHAQLLKENPIIEAAEYLHEKLCRWNHTDGCGWHYQNWDQPGPDRTSWLEKAEKALKLVDFETLKQLIEAVR